MGHGCSSMVRVKHSLQGVSKVSVYELKDLLNEPDITILDVRDVPDWDKSNFKISNAVRETPDDVASWIDKYDKAQILIVYCA
jgi:rhodanese-related sulfurtransferase